MRSEQAGDFFPELMNRAREAWRAEFAEKMAPFSPCKSLQGRDGNSAACMGFPACLPGAAW